MPPKEINVPPELIQAIKNDKLIIFVGAGLSYELKNTRGEQLKGWANLVEKILGDLENKRFDVAYLKGLIGKCEPIKILDLIESNKSLPRNVIADFVKEFIHLSKDNDFSLHKRIYQLSNKIITTNYDRAFEFAVEELERNTAYKGKNYELTKHKESHASLLFKLHGCYYHADSMVLFPTQYEDLYNNPNKDAEHALLVLKNIIMNKSVLFIGCGMGDFQINNFFKKIKELQGTYNQKHFIIETKLLDSSLDFLLRMPIREYSEIPHVIDKLLVEKEKNKQQKTAEVQELEKQLADTKEQLETLEKIKDDSKRKNKLLEREALKYFRRGVEFRLDNELEKAIEEYKVAVELKPNFHAAFYNLGNVLGDLAETRLGEEAKKLHQKACEKYERATQIKPDLYEAFTNWGNALRDSAKTKSGGEVEVLHQKAFEKYKRATQIKPDKHEALYNWGNALGDLAKTKSGEEAETLYQEAFRKYERATQIKPDLHELFYGWGNTLGDLAKTKSGEEAEILGQQACEKYEEAIKLNPNYYEACYNMGNVLGFLAEAKIGKDAEALREQACEKYQRAIQIKPDFPEAFTNLGNMLGSLARTKPHKEAETLYHQAFEKYKKAIDIKRDKHEAFNNWGVNLGDLAEIKSGVEAENLYHQAFEKYKRATEIKPDYQQTFTNWGNNLILLARTKSGEDAEVLWKEALDKSQKVANLGGSRYNLACAYSLLSDKENALLHLEQSLENEEIKTDYVLQDEDWKAYLKDQAFKKIIKKYSDK